MQSEYTTYDLKVLTYLIRLNVRAARLYGLDMSAPADCLPVVWLCISVVVKIMVPFRVPYILDATVLQ